MTRQLRTDLETAHPVVFAAAFVLLRWSQTNATTYELWRPLVLLPLAAASVLLVLLVLVRDRRVAAYSASCVFTLVVFFQIPTLIMIASAAWWLIVNVLRRRRSGALVSFDIPARVASVMAAALLVVGLASSAAVVLEPGPVQRPAFQGLTQPGARPNMYVLVLDGYARGDSLMADFGFDNAAFYDDLRDRQFSVSDRARSSYTKTWATMASLFNGSYLDELVDVNRPPDTAQRQIRLLHQAIQAGRVLTTLRDLGYEIVSIPTPVTTASVLTGATVRSTAHLTAFEVELLSSSLAALLVPSVVVDVLAQDQRANAIDQLELMASVAAEESPGPRLTVTHVMPPHPPFVMGQDPDYLDACFPDCDLWTTPVEATGLTPDAYAARVGVQIETLNAAVIDALDHLIATDPGAIILVMSDHGARDNVSHHEEHFRVLFAARTPGHADVFPSDISLVNAFRRVLTTWFGAGLDDLPYEAWASDWSRPLVLERVR